MTESSNMTTGWRHDLRVLMISLGVAGACLAVALALVTIGFESNDDVGMAQLASGVTTGTPSAELIFSNILIGSVLSILYRLTDRLNWYTLYLLGTHFLALTALVWAFLRLRPSRMALILFALLFVEFEVALLLRLQFTSTAIVAAIAGAVLILSREEGIDRRSAHPLSYGAALVVLAGLIRPDAMYYALLLLAPLFGYELIFFRRWRPFVTIGVAVVIAFGAAAIDGWHYRHIPEWREFMIYNHSRAHIHDLPIVTYEHNTRFFFDRIGWSYTDWGMFTNWFFTDRETFGRDRLEAILNRFEGSTWSRMKSDQYFAESLNPLGLFPPLVYANLILAIVLATGGRIRAFLVVVGECVLIDSLLLLFSWYAKLPTRIVLPAYFCAVVVAFYLALRESALRRHMPPATSDFVWLPRLSVAAAVAFAIYYAAAFYPVAMLQVAKSDFNRRDQQVLTQFVRTLRDRYVQTDPQAVFLNWAGRFPMFFSPPLDNYRDLRDVRMLGLGWNIHSPQFNAAVSQLGLADLYQATYTNSSVYLFTVPYSLQQLQRFVQEHYGATLDVKRADHLLVDCDVPPDYFATDFSVYQMELKKGSGIESISRPGQRTVQTSGKKPNTR